jgi:cytochrome P450
MVTHVHDPAAADEALDLLFDADAPAERFADPYALYERVRRAAPVHRMAEGGEWVVTRAADAEAVLRSPRWTSTPDFSQGWGETSLDEMGPQVDLLRRTLLFMDGDEHTRLRRLVQSAFTPKAVAALRPRVEAIVDELLTDLAERDAVDLIADFAFPVPVIVIAEMLGVPPEDRELFRTQIPKLTPLLEMGTPPEVFATAGEAAMTFAMYFQPLFEERQAAPRDDLISALVNAEVDGERIDPLDLLVTCVLLLGAGHETTMNLIGNGVLALLRHPEQLAMLRDDVDDEALPRSAVEELLRYDSPVQLTVRRAAEGAVLDGTEVAPAEEVLVLLGAANRDPDRFDDPNRLDLRRGDAHVAFGYGAHHCLGSALARLEGEVAIPALVRRFPGLALDREPVHRRTRTLRGVEALHVRLR